MNQKLNRGEVLAKIKAIYQTSKPNKKRKGQTFKNKSNSQCQSRADLRLLKATPSTKKAKRKTEPFEIAAGNSGKCLTKNFVK
jgi:hypothetical protein